MNKKFLIAFAFTLVLIFPLLVAGEEYHYLRQESFDLGLASLFDNCDAPVCSSLTPNAYLKHCDSGTYKYYCPNGQTCQNGGCVSADQCLTSVSPWGCSSLDGKRIRYVTNPDCSVTAEKLACPTGQKCQDGNCVQACTPKTTAWVCSALDGKRLRYVTNPDCSITAEKLPCPSDQICSNGECVSPPSLCAPYGFKEGDNYQCSALRDASNNHYCDAKTGQVTTITKVCKDSATCDPSTGKCEWDAGTTLPEKIDDFFADPDIDRGLDDIGGFFGDAVNSVGRVVGETLGATTSGFLGQLDWVGWAVVVILIIIVALVIGLKFF